MSVRGVLLVRKRCFCSSNATLHDRSWKRRFQLRFGSWTVRASGNTSALASVAVCVARVGVGVMVLCDPDGARQ